MDVEARRTELRTEVGPLYSGVLHFAFTSALGLSVIAYCASQVHQATWAFLTVPVTFLYANAVEYFGHKGPMHHRTRGLGLVYKRHTVVHHTFFTNARMDAQTPRDYRFVLFPPVLITFFFGIFGVPIVLAMKALLGTNVASLFACTAMGYFLLYEWLHLSYHSPRLARLPLLATLSRHHSAHHDPALMQTRNFNITFPIFDTLLNTNA